MKFFDLFGFLRHYLLNFTMCYLQYLDSMKQFVHENLKFLSHAPSVQMQDVPPDAYNSDFMNNEDSLDPDVRNHNSDEKRWVVHTNKDAIQIYTNLGGV